MPDCKRGNMLESSIEGRACTWARARGWLCIKLSAPPAGIPDRLFVSPTGVHVYIEFKTKDGRIRPAQAHMLRQLADRQCNVFVVRSIHEVREIVRSYEKSQKTLDVLESE